MFGKKKRLMQKVEEAPLFHLDFKPEIPTLPEIENKEAVNLRYPLIPPYAYAHIYWDNDSKELIYFVEEPELTDYEKRVLAMLEDGIKELINISFVSVQEGDTLINYLEKNIRVLLDELRIKLTKYSYLKLMYYIYRDFVGLNEVEPFLNDYFVEDIECNGVDYPIYIVHRKYRNLRTNITFTDVKRLTSFVEKLAQKCGQYISYATPLLDGALPDGSIDYEEPIISKENGTVKISKIGEFVDKYYKDNESNKPISVKNIEIPAFDKNTLKTNWKKLDYVYRHKINEDLFELKLEFGKKIKLTGFHSVFSLTKDGIKSERTDKLNIGDYIAIPLVIPENDVVKEINVAEELSKTKYANKLIIDNVPKLIYKNKKHEIIKFLNKNYKIPHQTCNEHKNKRILPLKLYKLLGEKDLRKCNIRPTSAVGIPTFIKINKEFIQLLGLYAAEGWLSSVSNQYTIIFCLNKKEKDLIEVIKNAAKKCFGLDIYVEPEYKNAVKVKINSYILWTLFNEVLKVSKGAKQKRIPNIIFNVNKELQQEFLKYWSFGDYGSTASKNLSNDISYLSLFNRDVVAFYGREREVLFDNLRKVKSYEYYTNFFVRDTNKNYPNMIPIELFNPLKETHHRLGNYRISRERLNSIINEKRYRRFMNLKNIDSIKFIKEWSKKGFIKNNKLTQKGNELIKELEFVNKLINSDIGFAKIKSISRVKSSREFVYDLSVKDHENFIGGCGGICCHNSRVNATFTEEISTRGPTFTVRKFTKEPWTPIQLMKFGTVSPELLAYLWILIEHELNIMIIGGTGSGKTTFLNALTFFIPPQARIVSIEDTRELNLKHDNWLPSVARAGVGLTNLVGQRYGEVSLFDLLKESFRQRPDYVIVGEVRGKEAFVLFQGMASLPGNEKILVLNSNERKMIPIKRINANISKAICVNPSTEKTEINQIKALIRHPSRNELIKIKTKTGREVTTTGDHSLFTYKNGILPIQAKNLKVNDCVVIPSRIPVGYSNISFINLIDYLPDVGVFSPAYIKRAVEILGYEKASKIARVKSISDYYANFKRSLPSSLKAKEFKLLMEKAKVKYDLEKIKVKFLKKSKSYNAKFKITPEFLRFLGYYIAEGSLNESGKNSRISLYAKNKETIKDMVKCIKALGCKPKKRITKGFGSSTELSFSHKVLFEFLLRHCKKGSSNKKIPNFIFGLSKEKIGEFLYALYKGDGGITRNSINYYTTSKKLANDLTYLLLELGIVAHIIKRGKSKIGKRENYEIKFYKAEDKREFLNYARIANKELINSIAKIKGKTDINKKNDIYLDKISSIEKIKLKKPFPVYDISVPQRQNFIGGFGGVMLHNSGHPSFSTMHANSVDTMIKRLQTPPINLSSSLVETLDVVCVITQTKVKGKEVRRIREINEIINVQEEKGAIFNTPFIWNPQTDSFFFKPDSYVFRKLYAQQGIQRQTLEREFKLRTKLLVKLYQHKIFNFKEVQDIINEYYKSPEVVLRRFKVI